MTEFEKNQIDDDVHSIIKECRESIASLRYPSPGVHAQTQNHRSVVIFLIESYLKAVCKQYGEQKAVRVKRIADKKKISRLQPCSNVIKVGSFSSENHVSPDTNGLQNNSVNEDLLANHEQADDTHADSSHDNEFPDGNMSPEEQQMFQEENKVLYNTLTSMTEDMRQIEGKVVEIAKLQEIFTENVLEQNTQIDTIMTSAIGTTNDVKMANEHIRDAIKKKAEYRVMVLFFIVICTFSLHFLHWFNV